MNNEEILFQIISLAGESNSEFILALQKAKAGEFDAAEKLIESGKEKLHLAHGEHMKLLTADVQGEKVEINILTIHAEDILMNAQMAETIFPELMELYRQKK